MGLIDSILGSAPDVAPQAPQAPQDNGKVAYDFFVNNGYAPHQAAGIVGNLQGESGQGLNPNALNPKDGRDGSDSIGIGQWNGTRAQALKDYAASKGVPVSDLNTQLEFLHSELKGPERAAYDRLTAAKTPEEAGQAMLAFERPKDWNKPGAHPERAQYAARAFSMYGGTNPSMAQPIPGSPAGLPSAPVNLIPPQAPPIFPQQAQQQEPQSQQPDTPPPTFATPQMGAPPMLTPIRHHIDLSKLRAALNSPPSRGFFYGNKS